MFSQPPLYIVQKEHIIYIPPAITVFEEVKPAYRKYAFAVFSIPSWHVTSCAWKLKKTSVATLRAVHSNVRVKKTASLLQRKGCDQIPSQIKTQPKHNAISKCNSEKFISSSNVVSNFFRLCFWWKRNVTHTRCFFILWSFYNLNFSAIWSSVMALSNKLMKSLISSKFPLKNHIKLLYLSADRKNWRINKFNFW